MSKDLNKVFIIGRLGQDPEVRYTSSGTAVANITVATSEKWKGKDSQLQEHTEWHRVVLWDKLGEIVSQYCGKGSRIHVEGALRTRKWQDQSGSDRSSTEIRATDVIMLDSKGDRPAQGNTERPSAQSEPAQDDGFDDIPF